MKKALIFDIDGTLWDSRQPVAIAWDHIIKQETGKSQGLNAENVSYLFGKPMDEIAALLFPEKTKDQQMALGRKCFDYETEYLAGDPGTLFPNVRQTLETLAKSYPLYIVSNCQCGYIEVFLKTMGLGKYIKDFLCFGQTQVPKNESIRLLMERNHLQDVVYVGDTSGDFDACQKADVPFIYASYGFGDIPDPPRQIGAIGELPALLGL